MESYKQKILGCLKEAALPLGVENIRVACNIGNWNTALKHCLELLFQGKIRGQKTSKSWVFWAEEGVSENE
ncbi:MAG: hypothetical protein K6T73_09675 [Candidatus Bathyarchaeota archaeon]|nr:hypothetical protein [Candidatus Bathyarchaeota archaeon]